MPGRGPLTMTRIIAFFNQEGGTAKTTSTLNVAAALAERGRRVLTVDLEILRRAWTDGHGALTSPSLEFSVYDVLLDEDVDVRQAVVTSTIPASICGSRIPIPRPPNCLLNVPNASASRYRLRALDLDAWDSVLIDSPPALNIISVNILVATRELVIPIEPHPLSSLMVLDRLFTTVERIRKLNPSLNVLGFLPTKVHLNSRLAMDMIATLEGSSRTIPLLPAIPLSAKSAESAAERTSVLHYMPCSPVATAYRQVGDWGQHGGPSSP